MRSVRMYLLRLDGEPHASATYMKLKTRHTATRSLTHRLHVPVQVRDQSRKALELQRYMRLGQIVNLVDSTRLAGDLSRSSGGHGQERSATPGRPSIDPPCILDPLPARF